MTIEAVFPSRSTQAVQVEAGVHTLYFSYRTLVGYRGPFGSFCRENVWGPTTGRHLFRDFGFDHSQAIPEAEFEKRLKPLHRRLA